MSDKELDPIEQAILNGDFDALDALANAFEAEGTEDDADKTDVSEVDETVIKGDASEGGQSQEEKDALEVTKPKTEDGEPSTPEAQEPAQLDASQINFDEQGNAIVPKELLALLSKDGKHQIPFEVLESTRDRAKELKAQLDAKEKENGELSGKDSTSTRKVEALVKQLKDAGIDPKKLPEEIELNQDMLDALDDYGEVGDVIKALVARTSKPAEPAKEPVQEPATQDNPRQNEYAAYLDQNKEFAAIMEDDTSDKFETVDLFFKQVAKSSAFKGKPLAEQLDEAMARTRKVFGEAEPVAKIVEQQPPADDHAAQDAISAKAQEALRKAQQEATPASPSEVGAGGQSQKKTIDRARESSGEDLLAVVGELSNEELEKLFDELDQKLWLLNQEMKRFSLRYCLLKPVACTPLKT